MFPGLSPSRQGHDFGPLALHQTSLLKDLTMTNWYEPRRPQEHDPKQINAHFAKGREIISMPKADGVRMQVPFDEYGNVVLRSRENKPFRALQSIEQRLNEPWLSRDARRALANWSFEFESMVIDQGTGQCLPCPKTSGALNASEQLLPGRLHLYLFDAISPEALPEGWDYERRLDVPVRVLQALTYMIHKVAFFQRLPWHVCHSLEELEKWYEGARLQGFEGTVNTPLGVPYAHGKKVSSGWKMKPEMTKDGVITGMVEAKAKDGTPKGIVGSFEVTYEDGTKGTPGAGAMTHKERKACWEDPEGTIGRLIEVKGMEEFEDSAAMRHPNFARWRDTPEHKGVKQ